MSRTKIDNQIALNHAKQAAHLGRTVLMDYFGRITRISEKKWAGLVSEADVESEKIITQYLVKVLPEYKVIGEESSYKKKGIHLSDRQRAQGVWLIDPLDGTTNYIHQFHVFCISIGLEVDNKLQVGVIDVPLLKKTYTAVRGGGSFVNDQPMHVSRRHRLKDCLMATGFSSYDQNALQEQLAIFSNMLKYVRGIRRAGSAAFDLCQVAEGVFDAYWEKNLAPWDMAAGALMVEEAGGRVTNYEHKKFNAFDTSIVASNSLIYPQMMKVMDLSR